MEVKIGAEPAVLVNPPGRQFPPLRMDEKGLPSSSSKGKKPNVGAKAKRIPVAIKVVAKRNPVAGRAAKMDPGLRGERAKVAARAATNDM